MNFFNSCLLALGLSASLVASQAVPIPPSQDPWYSAPAGFEKQELGAVLRIRAAPGNLSSLFPNSKSAWNLLFRTTDNDDKPSWAVTTVFAPKNQNGSSLVSYQIPYDTPYLDAASPSYQLYNKTVFAADGGNHLYFEEIQTMLGNGWFVNVPDMTGAHGALLSLLTESRATVDSIRAVLSLRNDRKTGSWAPCKNETRVALYGFSGGALASEFVAEIAAQYAPDLSSNLVGAAVNSMPGNITDTIVNLANTTLFAGLIPAGLVGLSKVHPALNNTLLKALQPSNESEFLSVESLWFEDIISSFEFQDMNQYFKSGSVAEFLRDKDYVQAVQSDAIAGEHGTPRMPLWSFQSVDDEVSDINATKALYQRYCRNGASVDFQINSFGGHLDSQTNGSPVALQWLAKALTGKYVPVKGCSFRNVTVGTLDNHY